MYLDTPSTIGIKKHEDVIKLQASLLAEHETSWASIVRKNLLKVEEEQKKEVLQGEDSTTTLPPLSKAGARTATPREQVASAMQYHALQCSMLQVAPLAALSLQSQPPGSACYPIGLNYPAQASKHHHSRLRGEKGTLSSFYSKASIKDKDVTSAKWAEWYGKEQEQLQKNDTEQEDEGEVKEEVRTSLPQHCPQRRRQKKPGLLAYGLPCTPKMDEQEVEQEPEEKQEVYLNEEEKVKAISSLHAARSSPCTSPSIRGRPRHAQIRAGSQGIVSVQETRPAKLLFRRPYFRYVAGGGIVVCNFGCSGLSFAGEN